LSTIIIYASTHGAAEEAARLLSARIDGSEVWNIQQNKSIDLTPFDTVIVGGSVRIGRIQRALRRFVDKNVDVLLAKRLGLYLCCMNEGDVAKRQLEGVYPEALRQHASATGLFGGRLDFERLSAIERTLVTQVAGIAQNVSTMDGDAMARFADRLTG
jgi:menaquinone-dependent protoporphyrinogen oxidase